MSLRVLKLSTTGIYIMRVRECETARTIAAPERDSPSERFGVMKKIARALTAFYYKANFFNNFFRKEVFVYEQKPNLA